MKLQALALRNDSIAQPSSAASADALVYPDKPDFQVARQTQSRIPTDNSEGEAISPQIPTARAGADGPKPVRGAKPQTGRKPDLVKDEAIKEIVLQVCGNKPWKDCFEDVCEALDKEKIPVVPGWLKHSEPVRTWTQAGYDIPRLVKKAIEYRLRQVES